MAEEDKAAADLIAGNLVRRPLKLRRRRRDVRGEPHQTAGSVRLELTDDPSGLQQECVGGQNQPAHEESCRRAAGLVEVTERAAEEA